MSKESQKNKQKDKKQEAYLELQQKYNEGRSQIIEKDIAIKHLQETNATLMLQLNETKHTNDRLLRQIEYDSERMVYLQQSMKRYNKQLMNQKYDLEAKNKDLASKLDNQLKWHEEQRREKEKQMDEYRKTTSAEIARYQHQAMDYLSAINDSESLKNENSSLCRQLAEQREKCKRDIAKKEKQSLQAMDLLKKEMMDRFATMKKNLLAIRKDQLDNNTRLTTLQNSQLVDELSYQSMNTAKVVLKNLQLTQQIKTLNTEMAVQKDMEAEIVKRSMLAKNVINTLSQKTVLLEQQLKQARENCAGNQSQQKNQYNNWNKQKEETLKTANNQIKHLERQLSGCMLELQTTRATLEQFRKCSRDLGAIVCQRYAEIMTQPEMKGEQGELHLAKLKQTDPQNWPLEDDSLVMKALLQVIHQLLSKKHFDSIYLKKTSETKNTGESSCNQLQVMAKRSSLEESQIEKSKYFYSGKRKLFGSLANERSSKRASSEHDTDCKGGYSVQGNMRNWGKQINSSNRAIASRFLKSCTVKKN